MVQSLPRIRPHSSTWQVSGSRLAGYTASRQHGRCRNPLVPEVKGVCENEGQDSYVHSHVPPGIDDARKSILTACTGSSMRCWLSGCHPVASGRWTSGWSDSTPRGRLAGTRPPGRGWTPSELTVASPRGILAARHPSSPALIGHRGFSRPCGRRPVNPCTSEVTLWANRKPDPLLAPRPGEPACEAFRSPSCWA